MLADVHLFSKAELTSLESDGAERPGSAFHPRLVVRPGYNQPGGPAVGNPEKFAIAPSDAPEQFAVPTPTRDQHSTAKSVAANH